MHEADRRGKRGRKGTRPPKRLSKTCTYQPRCCGDLARRALRRSATRGDSQLQRPAALAAARRAPPARSASFLGVGRPPLRDVEL